MNFTVSRPRTGKMAQTRRGKTPDLPPPQNAGEPDEITLSPLFRNYDQHYTVCLDFTGRE